MAPERFVGHCLCVSRVEPLLSFDEQDLNLSPSWDYILVQK